MARPITVVFFMLLAVLCALPFALLYFLAYTPQGLAAIVAHMPRRVGPVTMQIGEVRGTIAQGFHVTRFELTHERVHIVVDDAQARLAIAPLLWQTIDVPRLEAHRVLIEVRARKTPPENTTPRFLPRLLRIRAGDASADLITIVAPHGDRVEFGHARASGVVRHRSIRVFNATTDFEGLHVAANGTVRAADPMKIDATARAEWLAPKATRWVASVTAAGDLDRLAVQGHLSEPFRAELKGAAETLTSAWKVSGDAELSQLDLVDFGGGTALGEIDGRLAVVVNGEGIRADGMLHPLGLEAGEFDVEFDGKYIAKTLAVRHAKFRHRGSGAAATTSGRIRFEDGGPWLDLSGRWTAFRWPLPDDAAPVRSAQGAYRLHGEMPYAITAKGNVEVADLEPMQVALTGRLAADHLDADTLRAEVYGGRADLRGAVRWKPGETWQVAGRLSGLDTGLIDARIPGRIGLDIDARGEGFSPDGNLDFRFSRLVGEMRGGRASGRGQLIRRGSMLTFHDVDVRLGAAHAQLEGTLAPDAYALRFDVDADDLSLLEVDARGKLAARGTLSGTKQSPVIDTTLGGADLEYAGMRLASVNGRIRFDGRAGRPLDVSLQARGFTNGARSIDAFDITAEGTTDRHAVKFTTSAAPLAIAARGTGAFSGSLWQLQIEGVDLENGDEAALHLVEPSSLAIGRDLVKLETTCLRGVQAQVCATGSRDPQSWAVTLSAEDLPISTFTVGLTPGVTYEGAVDLEAAAGAEHGNPWRGSLRAELRDARTRRRIANNREDITVLGGGVITGSATAAEVVMDAQLDAGTSGGLTGHARAARAGADWHDWPLTGDLQVQTDSLGFLAVLVDSIDRAAGKLTADVQLAGTLGAPRLTGKLTLRDGELDFYQINLPLRAVTLDALFQANTLTLDGSATAGDGTAKTSGQLAWRDGLPYGVIKMQGENLRVANVPEARIYASPDLEFRIDGRRIAVTGIVKVPNARLDPADITNATFSSADEHIVGEREVDPSKRFIVTTDLKLVLGDRVTIDTYGLSGRLTGTLETRTDATDIARGTGELSIIDGKYVAFGRRLDIEHGKLIFSNGPLADPGIDIRASREFPDVTAGANVRGTLRAPRLTLFSEPQISQSQILSLLIAGGSLESVQEQDSTRRSNPFAVQGGAILAQQLGEMVGIEDVSLESSLNNETSLVLGKYLTPRLFVSYGVSLTEAINTIKMRYTLGDNWTVKLESGAVQSADLEYTIEK